MRFPLLAITAVAAAFATSNANADTFICHFVGQTFRMEQNVSASDNMSGETDVYRDGKYLGLWRYEVDLGNKAMATFSPDRSLAIGFRFPTPTPGSVASARANGILPMGESVFMVLSTRKQTSGDCTVYAKR
jgi:hypothetical protein